MHNQLVYQNKAVLMAPGVDGKLYAITVDSVIITVPVCGGALSQLGKKGNCYSDSSRVSARFKGGRKRQRLRGQLNLKKTLVIYQNKLSIWIIQEWEHGRKAHRDPPDFRHVVQNKRHIEWPPFLFPFICFFLDAPSIRHCKADIFCKRILLSTWSS